MNTTWHYKATTSYCSRVNDSSGTASCTGYVSGTTAGYTVIIDEAFAYNPQSYHTDHKLHASLDRSRFEEPRRACQSLNTAIDA